MNVLIIGSGGREHALAWRASLSPLAQTVYVAPGNPGTAREEKIRNVPIGAEETDKLAEFALSHDVGLTIVGPEAPLVGGVCDAFTTRGLKIFGPDAYCAMLEGSKSFTKDFLSRHHIPTAGYAVFTELEPAMAYLHSHGAPVVIKADGLAAGKGVTVAMQMHEAEQALKACLGDHRFGSASDKVVIEDFMAGEEASFIVMSDGQCVLPMASSQDHKRAGDGDTGPNTGGMGAYSPAPVVTPEVHRRVMDEIITPTISGLRESGHPYRGFLYAGLMIAPNGSPRVVEFNCRFGDPETQPIMLRMQSDLVELCLSACTAGGLKGREVRYDPRPAVGVVLAAAGYPEHPRKGDVITGLDAAESAGSSAERKLFHAGTAEKDGSIVTAGGRVLCATALGSDVREARDRAYELADRVQFAGKFCRRDIAWRALKRQSEKK